MPLQTWINRLSEGPVANALRLMAALMGFAVIAVLYDMHSVPGFTSPEAMESAQLARNLAQGKGFTTQTLRPIDVSLLKKQSPETLARALNQPGMRLPDVHNPPLYPALVAGVFKAFAFNLPAGQMPTTRYLELWIVGLNQVLFFLSVILLYIVAKNLFDPAVAGMSAVLFTATNLFWQFTLAGISTSLLILIFLGIVWCLTRILKRNAPESQSASPGGLRMALLLGVLIGLGCLTRYSFAFILFPVLVLLGISLKESKAKLLLAVAVAFSLVLAPWIARNVTVSGNLFGSASYDIFQQTDPFPEDTLERSLDVTPGLNRMQAQFYVDKLMVNARTILEEELPRLGGNWLALFFFVGILIPYRNKTLSKLRLFVLGSVVVFIIVEALGQTHVSSDLPRINTENFLAVLAPMAFVFAVSLFYSLLEPLTGETYESHNLIVGIFGVVICIPFIFVFLTPPIYPESNPYEPYYIQRAAAWMDDNELMVSDVPSAVAWHGEHPCASLPNNDSTRFAELSAIKEIKAVFLTQKTMDHQITARSLKTNSWERFAMEAWGRGQAPDNFPLTKAPYGFLPDRLLISDRERWRTGE